MLAGNSTTIALMFLSRKASTPVNRMAVGLDPTVRLKPTRSKKNGSCRGPANTLMPLGPVATTGGRWVAPAVPCVVRPVTTARFGKTALKVWQAGWGAGQAGPFAKALKVKSMGAVGFASARVEKFSR